jgi:uncharacterized membrane protein YedE/YeeE
MVVDVNAWLLALLGGGLIGIATGCLLLINGQIAGISGILGGALRPTREGGPWRIAFLAGMFAGGLLLVGFFPQAYPESFSTSTEVLIAAGLLVGFGTRMGNGCTSGHGVCGISRGSGRSITATITFIAAGAVTVFIVRHVVGA